MTALRTAVGVGARLRTEPVNADGYIRVSIGTGSRSVPLGRFHIAAVTAPPHD